MMSGILYNSLIRTHHITSRKKVAVLRKAAHEHSCRVLIRSGGSPGIMYCEGSEDSVKQWVAVVQRLRYKDYQLAARPEAAQTESSSIARPPGFWFDETATVKQFAERMDELGLLAWWRYAMGFPNSQNR